MVDILTKEQRSYNMSRILAKNTQPEISFRKLLSSSKVRGYRIHYKLIGKPDIAFPKYKIAVFIDGCFWHKCPKCFIEPATRKKFWMNKINSNLKRDKKVNSVLKKKGWKIIRFYEHQIRKKKDLNRCFVKLIKELIKRGYSCDSQ